MGGSSYQKLIEHMELIRPQLMALFEENKELLPKNSHLICGSCHGCWLHCPNHLADMVEKMIKTHHAKFILACNGA